MELDLDLSAVSRIVVSEPTGTERECSKCGVLFRAQRSTAKYCSQACRQAAYMDRPAPDPERLCRNCGANIGHKRANAVYCHFSCKEAFNNRLRATAVEAMSDVYPPDELHDALAESGMSITALFMTSALHQFDPERLAAVDAGEVALVDAFMESMDMSHTGATDV